MREGTHVQSSATQAPRIGAIVYIPSQNRPENRIEGGRALVRNVVPRYVPGSHDLEHRLSVEDLDGEVLGRFTWEGELALYQDELANEFLDRYAFRVNEEEIFARGETPALLAE